MGLLNRIRHIITAAITAARDPMEGRGAPRLLSPSPAAPPAPATPEAYEPPQAVPCLPEVMARRRLERIQWDAQPLGFIPDTAIARHLGVSDQGVFEQRKRRVITALARSPVIWFERRDVWQPWLAAWGEARVRAWITLHAHERLDALQAAVDFDEDATRPRKRKAAKVVKASPKVWSPPPRVTSASSAPKPALVTRSELVEPPPAAEMSTVEAAKPAHPPRPNAPKFWPDAPPATAAPVAPQGEAETVEQFLARGGQITRAAPVMPTEPSTRPCFPNRA